MKYTMEWEARIRPAGPFAGVLTGPVKRQVKKRRQPEPATAHGFVLEAAAMTSRVSSVSNFALSGPPCASPQPRPPPVFFFARICCKFFFPEPKEAEIGKAARTMRHDATFFSFFFFRGPRVSLWLMADWVVVVVDVPP